MTIQELAKELYECLRLAADCIQDKQAPTPAQRRRVLNVMAEAERMAGKQVASMQAASVERTRLELAGRRVLDARGAIVGELTRSGKMFVFNPTLEGLRLGYQSNWATTAERVVRLVTKS